jgi:cytochrome P450
MATLATTRTSIPGPRGLPLLGGRANLLKLFHNPFAYLCWLYDTYGDVVALAQGDPSYVFAFGPELNHQLLANPDVFENGMGLLRLPKDTGLRRLFMNNLAVMNGAHHKQQRKLMQPAFHKKQLVRYHDDMVALTQRTLDCWQVQSEIDLLFEMKQLTQRIAVKTLFGVYNEAELERIGVLLQRTIDVTSSPLFMIAPINVPGLPFHRANRLAVQLESYIRSVIAQKRAQPDATDVLAALVHVRDEDDAKLSDDELIGHAFTLFVAGHETTSNALTWTVFLLNQHPQTMADLLDELDSQLSGNAPTIEQLRSDGTRLPLLEGVIKESLRLLPPAPIGIRIAAAPCELGGYALPKGANIFYSEFITHRLPELYTEPNRFKPERWVTLDRSPYEYLPFSAGPHMCIGAGFAMQELKVVLALLLQRYRLAVVPNTKIEPNLRMRPPQGMPVRVYPQDRQFQASPVRGKIHDLVELR